MRYAACDKYFTTTAPFCAVAAPLTMVAALSVRKCANRATTPSVALAHSSYWPAIGRHVSNDGSGNAGGHLWQARDQPLAFP